jgi:hypothetical protein
MPLHRYFHHRTGARPAPRLAAAELKCCVLSSYERLAQLGYFQEALGCDCIDGRVVGTCGDDVAEWIRSNAWIDGVYPFEARIPALNEADLLTTIELLWEIASAPIERVEDYHSHWNCGWHYSAFDKVKGRAAWQAAVNNVLEFYGDGFQLSEQGEVLPLVREGRVETVAARDASSVDLGSRTLRDADVRDAVLSAHAPRVKPTQGESLPTGMSAWVGPAEVERALGCSRSKAHEYLRGASGRSIGTGELLRVPVDVWECWARDNLVGGRRRNTWDSRDRPRSTFTGEAGSGGAGSTLRTARASVERPARPTRRRLAPGLQSGSVLPLIPTLESRRR